jgi:alkyl hydroperoxide reductase subunit AhpF
MPELLNEQIKGQVKEALGQMQHPVQVLFFGSKENCDYCADTRQLAEEVCTLSDQLGLSVYDIQADAALATQYHVDKTPCLVIAAKDGETISDFGIRIAGIPGGYDFSAFIQILLLVANRDSGLSEQTRQALKSLKAPVDLQVFVTPT